MKRKLVYTAHPYLMKQENRESVERIILKLIEKHPDITFFSPIHATGYYYDKKTWEDGMKDCLELLSRCDELLLCPEWKHSKGCNKEHDYAVEHGIPISYLHNYMYETVESAHDHELCAECCGEIVHEGSCKVCKNCGYSTCG